MTKTASEVKVLIIDDQPLIVDDQPLIVEALCEFLENRGYRCVPSASGVEAGARLSTAPSISLLLCGLQVPPCDGIEPRDGAQREEAIVLERQNNYQHLGSLNQKLQYLTDLIDDLYYDLEKARGQGPCRRATDVESEPDSTRIPAIFEPLSPRQLDVARLVSKGKTNYQIACELGITENTVKLYVSQVLRLTHMHNRTQLALALAPGNSPLHLRVTAH